MSILATERPVCCLRQDLTARVLDAVAEAGYQAEEKENKPSDVNEEAVEEERKYYEERNKSY